MDTKKDLVTTARTLTIYGPYGSCGDHVEDDDDESQ